MKEILVTSSVLILALLALRTLFRKTISRRAQYALWLLVLARLLIPVNLPAMDHSVLTVANPVVSRMDASFYITPVQEEVLSPGYVPVHDRHPAPYQAVAVDVPSWDNTRTVTDTYDVIHKLHYEKQIPVDQLLLPIWWGGMAVMAAWFIFSNLRFWTKLRKARIPYAVPSCPYPVYLVEEGLPSPCLFGLVRPAVYLTPASAVPERVEYVLAHETTHAKHGDPLWSLLRSVCLVIYWFDPLVWTAAILSRNDEELACDEGALKRLGEQKRIAYGQTLLSLIPIRKGPGNPLLSATTMTAGKRQMKDRITRIAQKHETRVIVLFLALVLALGVCVVTFTGASIKQDPTVPLTEEELAYFNQEYFNGEDFNIRNQFLSSLYASPEEIDLFELFYCGVTGEEPDSIKSPSEEEERLIYGDALPDCPRYKATTADFDAILQPHTGLILSQTQHVGMENFVYLPEYDAHYWAHGDTNYRGSITFSSGERQGDLIRLYYDDTFLVDGAKCLTLSAQSDGSYWFVSNQCLPSRPAYEPDATIDLREAPLYEEPEVTMEGPDFDLEEIILSSSARTYPGDVEHSIVVYRTTGGALCAGITESAKDLFEAERFLTLDSAALEGAIQISSFSNVLGHDGFTLHFYTPENVFETWYYYFDDDGAVHLLAQASDIVWEADLDDDGTQELLWRTPGSNEEQKTNFLFSYDGYLHLSDLNSLIRETYPQCDYLNLYCWGQDPDHIIMEASTRPISEQGNILEMPRNLYYKDGILDLYRVGQVSYNDHVAEGINVPDYALSVARQEVMAALSWWQSHTGAWGMVDGQEQQVGTQAQWDDWRITGLSQVDLGQPYTSLGLEIYSYSYELHASTPELVESAGGMYIQEDGWVGGFYVESPFLVFLQGEDGEVTQLEASIPGDVGQEMSSPMFAAAVAQVAMDYGLLVPSKTDPETLLNLFYANGTSFLNAAATFPEAEQTAVVEALASFHNQGLFQQEADLRHTMQNVVWTQRNLTEGGKVVWQALLNRTGIQAGGIGGSYDDLDEAILQSILDHRRSASAHKDDFYAAAYDILATNPSGNTQTVYLYICFGSYDLTEDGYAIQTGGEEPAALTFATVNGLYQLTEYWTPGGGAHYDRDLRTVFPEEAAERVLSREGWEDLSARCDQMAQEQYSTLQEEAALAAQAQEVEFTNQPLEISEIDPMTYQERLEWCQGSWRDTEESVMYVPSSAQADGTYIAYTGNMAGGSPGASAWKSLYLRFPDGALANLPLPHNALYSTAAPDTMNLAGDVFTYAVTFQEELINQDDGSLIHLKGKYQYTVNLESRTVSLQILPS